MTKANIKSMSVGRSDVFKLPLDVIQVQDGYNDRTPFTHRQSFKELKDDIRQRGILIPLTVKVVGENIFVRSGHRRLAAALQLIQDGVEFPNCDAVQCLPFKGSEEDEIIDVISSNTGEPLSSLEQGYTMLKLETTFGHDAKTIAEKTSKSLPHVYNCLKLAKAPESVRQALAADKVTTNVVLDAISKHKKNPEALEKAIEKAIETAKNNGQTKAKKPATGPKKASVNVKKIITERIEFLEKQDKDATLTIDKVIELLTKIRDYQKQDATEKEPEKETVEA